MTQIKQATIKFRAGDVKNTPYGERQNVVILYPDGSEDKLWFSAGRQPHASLKKGQAIQVLIESRDGKTIKKLVEPETSGTSETSPAHSVPQTQPHQPLSNERKKEIAAYVEEQANLYKFCLQQALPVTKEIDGDLEDARAIATTLFIAAQRKFGL